MDDVTLFTEELLKQDYYYALLSYGNQCQFKTRKEMDRYHKLLPAINKLYNKGILSARLYDIADEVERYIAYGIFAFVWLSAIAGFILSFKKLKEHSNLETACYVGMGACILVAMKPLLDHLGELGATTAFWWLIGGGVSYIVGAVFYSLRKPYMHATFHLFCLGGSIGHIIAIWLIL